MKILCFRNSKIGDYLVAIPSLKLIRKKYPKSKIFYLTNENKDCKYLPKKIENDVIVDDIFFYKNNFSSYLKLIFKLRNLKFDIIINFQEETNFIRKLRNYLFFKACKIPKMIGFFYKNKSYFFQSETIQLAKRTKIKFKKNEIKRLYKLNKKIDQPLIKKNYITISHGGISSPRLWAINNWKILLKQFTNTSNCQVIILGTHKEKKQAISLNMINKKKIINMCGKTKLPELFNLIKYSKAHVTNDNGTMHIATIYEKKCICLFNNHDPIGKWFPLNKNAKIYRPKNGVNDISPYDIIKELINLI